MGMKRPDDLEDRRIILGIDRLGAGEPRKYVGVLRFHEIFELVEFDFAELIDAGVGELAEQQIDLAHAAMPAAEQDSCAGAGSGLRSISVFPTCGLPNNAKNAPAHFGRQRRVGCYRAEGEGCQSLTRDGERKISGATSEFSCRKLSDTPLQDVAFRFEGDIPDGRRY